MAVGIVSGLDVNARARARLFPKSQQMENQDVRGTRTMINDEQKEVVRKFARKKRGLGLSYGAIIVKAKRELPGSVFGYRDENAADINWCIFAAISEYDAEVIVMGGA